MKYRYIVHYIEASRDHNMFILTDTRSGRSLRGRHVPEANVRMAIYFMNGQEHKGNYYFATTTTTIREFKAWWVRNVPYIGCQPEEIAARFIAMMKSRKPDAGRPVE